MDQNQASGDPELSSAAAAAYDGPELWGAAGVIGDGRYRLVRRLGRGGMAEVFGAEDVRLGRTVAVKLLRSDLAEDPVAKKRFTREAQSVAGLNHHAVVAVYDSGEEYIGKDLVPYIVMELCEGRTIRELLQDTEGEPPPIDQALIIVSGVLEALAYSHQHGIVHRDIKPANVIITTTGAVKVMDFGIARALHGASNTMTQTGMVMGTPQYLSPEQALGKAVDHRSDLYATGCLLYELLTLRPPFTGETPLSVVYQHVQDYPQIPSEVSGRVPPELDGLVLRSLAKNPDDRFQSAEEMHGLVHYALRMLHERGGWTGDWDTGYVEHHEGPATGMPGAPAATTMLPNARGQISQTAQLGPPLLMGAPGGGGEDGYDDGYDGYGDEYGRSRGSGAKYALLVVAALVAIAVGVFIAVNGTSQGSGDTGNQNGGSPAPSVSTSTSPSSVPSDTTTTFPSETNTSPSDQQGSGASVTGPSGTSPSQPTDTSSVTPTPTLTPTPTPTPSNPANPANPSTSPVKSTPSSNPSSGLGGLTNP